MGSDATPPAPPDSSLRPRRPHRRSALRQAPTARVPPRRSEFRRDGGAQGAAGRRREVCARAGGIVRAITRVSGVGAPCQTSAGRVGREAEGWGLRVRVGALQPAAAATAVFPHLGSRAAGEPGPTAHRPSRRSLHGACVRVRACLRSACQTEPWRASALAAAAAAVRVLRSATASQPALLLPFRPTCRSPRDPIPGLRVDAGSDLRPSQA